MKFTLVQPHAVALSARRFSREAPLGLGRYRSETVRSGEESRVYNTYLDLLEYADHARL